MVNGLGVFKQYFEGFPDNYIIIGGTACDIIIEDAGFRPRTTKDIDIILVVEALSPDFVQQFWQFIKDGNYEQREQSADERKYYRFMKPQNPEFPFQIELFSRKPDLIVLEEAAHLTVIPVDDDLSSLSAILLNEDYYNYIMAHSTVENGLHRANTEALICLKAKAFLEIQERIANGSNDDSKQLKKHKADIFRLAATLTADDIFETPEDIKQDFLKFSKAIVSDLPDKAMFKEMGLSNTNAGTAETVFKQLLDSFSIKLDEE